MAYVYCLIQEKGGDRMLIQKKEFYAFKDYCKGYFKKNRHGRSVNVLERLKKGDRKLYRTIEKAVGKQKIKGWCSMLCLWKTLLSRWETAI